MSIHDIYGYLRSEIAKAISESWKIFSIPLGWEEIVLELEEPPIEKFGDISLPTHKFAKIMKTTPMELAKIASENLKLSFIKNVVTVGGYLNIFFNESEIAKMLFNAIGKYRDTFGFLKTEKAEKIVVDLVSCALNDEELPRYVYVGIDEAPKLEEIPLIKLSLIHI